MGLCPHQISSSFFLDLTNKLILCGRGLANLWNLCVVHYLALFIHAIEAWQPSGTYAFVHWEIYLEPAIEAWQPYGIYVFVHWDINLEQQLRFG